MPYRVSEKIRKARFPVLTLVIFLGMTGLRWCPDQENLVLGDLAVLKGHGTRLAPILDESLPAGKNVLWCATFQMAWDAACKRLGRPIQLLPGSGLADSLNKNSFDRSWVDESSVFADEGNVDDGILTKISSRAGKMSGRVSPLVGRLKKFSGTGDIVFFAMLDKNLKFGQPFGKLGCWKLGDQAVPWFGFTPDQENTGPLRKQVLVHHYAAKDDFVIELLSKEPGDQLLLAKLPASPETSSGLSRNILKRLQANAPEAAFNDLLAVPNVVADESAEFSQIEGRTVVGKDLFVRTALQTVDFRMDEKGAKLHSEAEISFGCSARARIKPRLMILTPPFALILKRRNAPQPYFLAWFANADLLRAK